MNTEYIESEGIRCYGISYNRENRLKDCTITEEDSLLNLNAQDLIEQC